MAQQALTNRRSYNRWVANQTLEDYALRFTAKDARRWSAARVSNTALGAISFLALEAIGAAITLIYGVQATVLAVMVVSAIIFLTAIPISYYAARDGVDIDLLTRGAGFGYIGSTVTSLIYASFTFIFFALESAIMASALDILFGLPLWAGYLISAVVVIPLVTHGITLISRFQLWTQPLWLALQLAPFVFILWHEGSMLGDWSQFEGIQNPAPQQGGGFNLYYFGAASAVIFSLIAQIGEQVDFLRYLPEPDKRTRRRWWAALLMGGPGWILVGVVKILAGSFLAVLALNHGLPVSDAADPTQLYIIAFSYLTESPLVILALTGIFVVLCQVKINVTNAYAGSIAWSNFFSRLTHSHPGRVVWLFFNVMIALMLMALGVYESLEHILGIYSNVAVAWVGALVADLIINKPLGLSPKHIEFKRAYLYDINPVGFGSMILASLVGIFSYVGVAGPEASALSPYLALLTAFVTSPVIALVTRGRFYLARDVIQLTPVQAQHRCVVCDNDFDAEDMASCPAYKGHICSLCCTLESRCHDQCKDRARFSDQIEALLTAILPQSLAQRMRPGLLQFTGLLTIIGSVVGLLFWLVYMQVPIEDSGRLLLSSTLIQVYLLLLIIVGVLIWLFVLANESRELALGEANRQTELLTREIAAHEITDRALQDAKELAEAANLAKSRYLGGISHELRSPLNSILGYAQLLEKDASLDSRQSAKVSLIRRSGDHLADLIEGLLDISRIEAGRLEVRRDEVRIHSLLQELTEMFRLQAAEKGIEFNYQPPRYLPEVVRTDEKHLRQILINLLSNAVKFTQQGSVTLKVRYRSQVAEFTVSDTGSGIAEEERERIFQPFERIRKPGTVQQPGTGLGLTISQLLSDIMGGEISLESEPGKGSTFRLSLMLSSVSNPVPVSRSERAVSGYEGPEKTILVVDDNATHRGLVSEILQPAGFRILEATDAFSAAGIIHDPQIDLVLLDISMPGKTGWEFLREIRESGFIKPVIMVSADAEDKLSAAGQGAAEHPQERLNNDYLIKPIRDQVLLQKVGNALGLTWVYESDAEKVTTRTVTEPGVSVTHARQMIEMAELGYVSGIEELLVTLKASDDTAAYARETEALLRSFRFNDIISMNRKVVDHGRS
jgi:signal transduction histidine kinase/CheY-like chemotaxis protein/purine-cytosine permease-like protein